MDTSFKPDLETYGEVIKYQIKINYLLVLLCVITPATNWAIPFVRRVKGSIYYKRYLDEN